ncbi:MAG: hypothetical protein JWO59_2816 [Chloroflexi bacterium]|nr:hypothetical protein [Chloroflexota bacterium]
MDKVPLPQLRGFFRKLVCPLQTMVLHSDGRTPDPARAHVERIAHADADRDFKHCHVRANPALLYWGPNATNNMSGRAFRMRSMVYASCSAVMGSEVAAYVPAMRKLGKRAASTAAVWSAIPGAAPSK